MPKPSSADTSKEAMKILSELLLTPNAASVHAASVNTSTPSRLYTQLRNQTRADFDALLQLAHSNHVVIRGLEIYAQIMSAAPEQEQDRQHAEWARTAVSDERTRIATATRSLRTICDAFDDEGLDITVMKSLDHWPDFGSDMDLFSNASPERVCELMQRRFQARIASRSWGDRLAGKWNFELPMLPESVEIHIQRLGQTGEQLVLAASLPRRSRVLQFDSPQSESLQFRVPSASDRIMISTLQRMYRHFYFRLCDIVDSADLARSGALDYADLQAASQSAGIWPGVATYLVLVSDYVQTYGSPALDLPQFVKDAARFNGSVMYYGKPFLRVPIKPQAAGLYRLQLTELVRRREVHSSARLGLLPWLATAAAIGYKVTGSDKGIW